MQRHFVLEFRTTQKLVIRFQDVHSSTSIETFWVSSEQQEAFRCLFDVRRFGDAIGSTAVNLPVCSLSVRPIFRQVIVSSWC